MSLSADSAEVKTALLPLPQEAGPPWSELALPSAENSFVSDLLLACLIWTALLALVAWAYLSAQWIGLL